MNTINRTKSKRLVASLGIAAGAAVTPALLLGAGTTHAALFDPSGSSFPSVSHSSLPWSPLWPQPLRVAGSEQ
jgi:hypothetical protein